jgi:hypothetical protein
MCGRSGDDQQQEGRRCEREYEDVIAAHTNFSLVEIDIIG